MQQRREPAVIVQREIALAIADEPVIARRHLHRGPLVLVGVEIRTLRLAHQHAEHPRKLRQPLHVFNPRNLPRILLAVLVALPNLQVLIRLPHKQNLAMLLIHRIREQQQHTLLLLNAAQEKQVGIGLHRQRTIGIGWQHVVGIQNGQGTGCDQIGKPLAVLDEQFVFDWLVSHDNS